MPRLTTDSAMVESLIDTSEHLTLSHDKAVAAGHLDIAADIRRAQWLVVRAIAKCAKQTIVIDDPVS